MKLNGFVIPRWLTPALAVLYFLIAGLILIPWPGWQNDELFFAGPLYDRTAAYYYATIGATRIPLMVASYTGALKTWFYAVVFSIFPPSSWSIRVPMLLAGALALWLTWNWMIRIGAGRLAASVTIVLLATDTSFLLTSTFDWGPVALQHLFLMAGLVAFQSWIARGSLLMCGLAFFLWGVGVWDKALMFWPLSGLALACLLVYPREVIRRLRPAPVFVAIACVAAGTLPFLWFNIDRPAAAFVSNINLSADDLHMKVRALRESVDGSSMFDYLVYRDSASVHRSPATFFESISVAAKRHLGSHERNWMPFGFALAGILIVVCRKSSGSRPVVLLILASAIGWLEMLLNKGTGTFVHHVILLWPLPVAAVGLAFVAAVERWPSAGFAVVAAATCLLALGNVLTTNEYLADFITNGGATGWTDAIYNLSTSIGEIRPSWVGLIDWGCLNDLRVLQRGRQGLFEATATAQNREDILRMSTIPDLVLVTHVNDKQILPHVNDTFRHQLLEQGFTLRPTRSIPDREGRSVFELFTLGGS